jgi:hypothetical protein
MTNNAAVLELLASYEAALDDWKRTHEAARRLRDLAVEGKPVSPMLLRMIDAALDHDEGQLADLRVKMEQFREWFGTH